MSTEKKTDDTIEFEFDGHALEVDPRAARSYRTMKAIALADTDPHGFFAALDDIFGGRADEYVELAGGSMEDAGRLVEAALSAANAKN